MAYEIITLAAENPCDGDCGGTIGRDYRMCNKGWCFDVYCRSCADDHELKVHIGPHERAVLAAWRLDAAQRRLG